MTTSQSQIYYINNKSDCNLLDFQTVELTANKNLSTREKFETIRSKLINA